MKAIFLASFVAAFLAVLAPAALAGSVTVNWIAPTENEDGTPATLSGFEIGFQVTAAGPIRNVIINDPRARSHVIDSVDPGAVVIVAMRAIGDDGQKSVLSNTVQFTAGGEVVPRARPRPPTIIDPATVGALTITTQRVNEFTPVGARNLTALGSLDWFYMGRSSATDFDHKQGGALFTLAPVTIGGGVAFPIGGAPENQAAASWTNGTPTPAATDERDIAFIPAVGASGSGLSLRTGALGSGRKRLVIGHSSFEAAYDVVVTLADAQPVVERITVPRGAVHAFETAIEIDPTTDRDTLSIEIRNAGDFGNVVMQYGTAEAL